VLPLKSVHQVLGGITLNLMAMPLPSIAGVVEIGGRGGRTSTTFGKAGGGLGELPESGAWWAYLNNFREVGGRAGMVHRLGGLGWFIAGGGLGWFIASQFIAWGGLDGSSLCGSPG
jgi:hypothetical protein